MNNDEGNIGIITNERIIENLQEDKKNLYKVVDKLVLTYYNTPIL